jgi:hypothetical protein
LKYAHRTDPNTSVYSVWLGSRKNASVKNYMLKTGAIQSASIVRAAIGKKQGVRLPAEKSGDAVRIPVVDESVTYIIVQSK